VDLVGDGMQIKRRSTRAEQPFELPKISKGKGRGKDAYDELHVSWVGHICAVVCVCLSQGYAVES
jgi:hypothetical protein